MIIRKDVMSVRHLLLLRNISTGHKASKANRNLKAPVWGGSSSTASLSEGVYCHFCLGHSLVASYPVLAAAKSSQVIWGLDPLTLHSFTPKHFTAMLLIHVWHVRGGTYSYSVTLLMRGGEPIPLCVGWAAGWTLDRMTVTPIGNFRCMFFGCAREPKHLEETRR